MNKTSDIPLIFKNFITYKNTGLLDNNNSIKSRPEVNKMLIAIDLPRLDR